MVKPHIADYLDSKGIRWQARSHPRRISAQEVAEAEHVSGSRFAKTVVVKKDGALALIVVPAHRLVDLARLSGELGGPVSMAQEVDFAGRFRDCEVGAMPPLGELYGVPVFVDESLGEKQTIVFNAGTHGDTIELNWDDFAKLAPITLLRCVRSQAA